MIKLNKSADREALLRSQDKVEVLNKQNHIESTERFNIFNETIREDYYVKDKQSQVSAAKVILTA